MRHLCLQMGIDHPSPAARSMFAGPIHYPDLPHYVEFLIMSCTRLGNGALCVSSCWKGSEKASLFHREGGERVGSYII